MACFTCRPNSFRSISKAMAKGASARMRRIGMAPTFPEWTARAAICETCPMRVVRGGVTYCGTPFLQLVDRNPVEDGCGCPTHDKAKSPDEHCPVDEHFKLPVVTGGVIGGGHCNCRWCVR